ncbi:hypothetical protein CQY20_16260 [Mycolicibacterium agri]|uniref:Agglutinin receptor n=2 Tax=Mycolicibacterium agri TaxID=36811 RepID=A0A2A7MZY3_MYCAG|nr:hypothetical protein [Mycolicibacterium agri]PEG37335.1 hypothetical protein CQY20_16260 [Mycolicibacterium agri]GFG52410.1 hypothetical protein MAGR_38510 [Mycolicibacterium agri]
MDLVLGLSVTSTAVRWVLVEGWTGDGDAVDRGALDIDDVESFDAEALLTVLLDANETVLENGLHAVGVTWTTDGDIVAGAILAALEARGVQNVVSVSEVEAAEALAGGIAALAGYQDVAVCVFEPDATLVAVVGPDGVTVDRQELPADGNIELASSVIALDLNDRQLDAVFVVGSTDLEPVISSMDPVAAAPVISSAEADMAMTRGAAVAAALAVNALTAPPRSLFKLPAMSTTRVLTSVVAAAAVTLVVSLSVALGMRATPGAQTEQTKNASATGEQAGPTPGPSEVKAALAAPKLEPREAAPAPKPEAAAPKPEAAAPKPAPAAPPPAPEPAAPPVAQTMAAAPPAPAAVPEVEPPAAVPPAPEYVPPAPVYTPPAPAYSPPAPAYSPPAPAYAPPVQPQVPAVQPQVPAVQPQPRLRDKIIERIPIINRFHEPKYEYPNP